MIYNLANPYEVAKFEQAIRRFIEKGLVVEMKEKKGVRSLKQNAYLHVIIAYFACEYGCSVDDAKYTYYKMTCNYDLYNEKVVNKFGKEIDRTRSSKDLDKAEMTTSIERFRNWSASVASIYLPSPQEHDYLVHCMQVIEENKEFIEQQNI